MQQSVRAIIATRNGRASPLRRTRVVAASRLRALSRPGDNPGCEKVRLRVVSLPSLHRARVA